MKPRSSRPTPPRRKARVTVPFLVRLTRHVDEDDLTIPMGSGILVEKVLKRCYRGSWSSCRGTYTVTVPKSACVFVRDWSAD